MKKILTLFERVFKNHKKVGILPNVTTGMEWVLEGEGIATEKMDRGDVWHMAAYQNSNQVLFTGALYRGDCILEGWRTKMQDKEK